MEGMVVSVEWHMLMRERDRTRDENYCVLDHTR